MRWPRSLCVVLLGVYLILVGLSSFGVSFRYPETIIGILAIAAGVLILIQRQTYAPRRLPREAAAFLADARFSSRICLGF